MKNLIHEILNNHLITIRNSPFGESMKVIRQEDLGELSDELEQTIEANIEKV